MKSGKTTALMFLAIARTIERGQYEFKDHEPMTYEKARLALFRIRAICHSSKIHVICNLCPGSSKDHFNISMSSTFKDRSGSTEVKQNKADKNEIISA